MVKTYTHRHTHRHTHENPSHRPPGACPTEAGLAGQAPDGPFSSRSGHHVVGHVDDFSALQQQLLEGCVLIRQIGRAHV